MKKQQREAEFTESAEHCYCGCCGREIACGLFCAGCGPHLLSSRLPPEERTYFAQHGRPCPLAQEGESGGS